MAGLPYIVNYFFKTPDSTASKMVLTYLIFFFDSQQKFKKACKKLDVSPKMIFCSITYISKSLHGYLSTKGLKVPSGQIGSS
jgi:hypothetical protein